MSGETHEGVANGDNREATDNVDSAVSEASM